MWKNKTLATRIVVLVAAAFAFILIAFYFTVKLMSHEALKKTEKEKAQLILDTAAPLIAVRMHLQQDKKTRTILNQMMENPNVVSVKIIQHHQVLAHEKKHNVPLEATEYFTLRQEIRDPLNKTYLADLVLSYSNAVFTKQSRMYDFTLLVVMELLALFVILFTLYLRKLLKPLRNLTSKIKNFEPGKNMQLPTNLREDEIGQINAALTDMNERISEYDSAQRDKTQQLESEIAKKAEELEHLLYTDNLTHLPNRMKLLEDLEVRIDSVLIIANIDAFRQINDFYGQQAGDHVIQKVAAVLEQFSSNFPNMQTYRLSADEFAIFSQLPIEEDILESFLYKISEYFDVNAIMFEDIEIDVHITMGATRRIEQAIEKADIALKSARKNRLPFLIYDEEFNIESKYEANMLWLRKLKFAMANDNIIPYFQPIFDNQDHRIVSYECLMRMREGDGAILTPSYFLEVAKHARLYTRLTRIIVEKCCNHFRDIEASFSINLSSEDIHETATREFIKNKVLDTGVGKRMIFEILESEGIENYEEVSRFIDDMKAIGCRFAIDDFGTGYSNFEHLLRLNIDIIKIDGSLIEHLDKNDGAVEVVETIVEFIRRRKLVSVAEYVHSGPVFDIVKRLGIDRSQGHYLGEPKEETVTQNRPE